MVDVVERWARHLRATGRSANTITSYTSDVRILRQFVDGVDLLSLTESDISKFLADEQSAGRQSATITRRFRSLTTFYSWLVSKREVSSSPMEHLSVPTIDTPQTVLTAKDLAALLGACADENASGRHGRVGVFEARRDSAIVLLLMTTGLTASELIALTIGDFELENESVRVSGRDGRERIMPLLHSPVAAIQKYFLVREEHLLAESIDSMWLGERGQLTTSGLRQMLQRRSALAGISRVVARDFRRTFAHDSLQRGVSEEVVAAQGGWRSLSAVVRYRPPSMP